MAQEKTNSGDIDDFALRDNVFLMTPENIQKITLAYNKILAVLLDPDVREILGDDLWPTQQPSLPEIQLDDQELAKGS